MTRTFDPQEHVFRSPAYRSAVTGAVRFFIKTPVLQLPPPRQFPGGGVYALYYAGSGEPYTKLGSMNRVNLVCPIYVGKAVPPGWRTARSTREETGSVFLRLKEHSRSIAQTQNLAIEDFHCRFIIMTGVETDLVVPVEAELIRQYKPLWNSVVDGFGNHDPGSGRYNQSPSEWDILHPGRSWAAKGICA